ncbi:hypothetical protein AXG93_4368s1850 [Marchantia polymorpha subsp. ruderalis]|uniref:Uncharacterized protein n=1 Tax=Marchantia polymorpha subsp. ruderalis TaxID=1480154 RepID=A0A176VZU6_MARPO|nr:hypothetical protein AXG93_4368s1850 [Marchantia polymorpha subsp. ruderalis]
MECPPLLEPRPSAIRDTTRKRMIGVGDELVSFIPASIHPSSQPASQPSIHPAEKELEGGRHSDSRLIGVFGTHSTPSRSHSRAPREERSMQTNRTGSDNSVEEEVVAVDYAGADEDEEPAGLDCGGESKRCGAPRRLQDATVQLPASGGMEKPPNPRRAMLSANNSFRLSSPHSLRDACQ